LDRVTGLSVTSESAVRYLEMFLNGYHTEEQLVQEARPQTGVPLTRKHSGD
jgi:hypothetical protein